MINSKKPFPLPILSKSALMTDGITPNLWVEFCNHNIILCVWVVAAVGVALSLFFHIPSYLLNHFICEPFIIPKSIIQNINSLRLSDTCMWVNQVIIGSDNGLSPARHQAIIWTNDDLLLIRPLEANFSEILIEIQIFSLTKTHLKMSSVKWCHFVQWEISWLMC